MTFVPNNNVLRNGQKIRLKKDVYVPALNGTFIAGTVAKVLHSYRKCGDWYYQCLDLSVDMAYDFSIKHDPNGELYELV